MKNFSFIILLISFLFLISGCKTIKEKTDSIIEKENQKLSTFIGKSSSDLKIESRHPRELETRRDIL